PVEPGVVTVGTFHAGTATNIIPDEAKIEGTARTLSPKARLAVKAAIERRCRGVAAANNCELKFDYHMGYPPTINDPKMTDYIASVARKVVGSDRYLTAPHPSMGGEDFAYYLEQVPGCFFLIGVQPAGADRHPPLHSDRFDFTDAATGVGVRMFVEAVVGFRG
ncbi:MAG TPA: M20/M25/M40 family metallo-hydrolase, partial [Humisphaera sp.]